MNTCTRARNYNILLIFCAFISVFLCLGVNVSGQSVAEINNIRFIAQNDTLIVTYDINQAVRKELFDVSLIITTSSGKLIRPRAVCGDVGPTVTGGKGKRIYWDLNRDQIFLNEGIEVEIEAVALGIPMKFVSRGKALLLSTFVPGLGITKLNKGGPYWLMAVATYGAAAGSVVFYYLADDNFKKYLASMDIDERSKLHSKVETQNTISDVLMYSAGAVWLGNMIWTLSHPNKTKQAKGLSFGGSFDPVIGQPVLAVKYRFN
ncbi:MAG: hypothetical protein D4R67_11130 [Bacteroidetes bacterium]|nr:MAG: hypothetical protein D4R67_11130 [Bacteroidota bacterium]